MADLTEEQKEQLKMARRANMRIEETWSLFTMFLSADKPPHEALRKAEEAVAVWVEWMDNNEVEPPDIKRPDFGEQITETMQKMFGAKPFGMVVANEDAAAVITAEPIVETAAQIANGAEGVKPKEG